jgi:hypothetical protein
MFQEFVGDVRRSMCFSIGQVFYNLLKEEWVLNGLVEQG